MKLLKFSRATYLRTRLISILTIFIYLQNVNPTHSLNAENGVGEVGLVRLSLVILLSATRFLHINGATILDGKRRQLDESPEYSEEILTIRPRILRRRFGRQMSMLAPALQTMGCLPKFFCGMNSNAPSQNTSTLNDLAYLIKFAMVDDDLEDSSEKAAKDALNSESDSEDEEKKKEDQRFENMAEEQMILDDPEYLNFIWKDMKKKIKNKFKDGRIDEQILNQMMSDMEAESNAKLPYKPPSLFSGLKNLLRIGRSADESHPRRIQKSFWDTEEFDEQMKLAARIGQASNTDGQCTSTFNLCPYTIKQMKNMVTGDRSESDIDSKFRPLLYDDPRPKLPPLHPTTPNPVSHAVYLLNPDSVNGRRPPPKTPKPIPSTSQPKPERSTISIAVKPQPTKQFYKGREPEDDESGFDNPAINFSKDIIPPASSVKVIAIKGKGEEETDEVVGTSSEEEFAEEPSKKVPPKFKSTSKTKVTKLNNIRTKNSDKSEDGTTSSEEELKEKSEGTKSSTSKQEKPAHKTQKIKIGLPRPKYSIKHKYRNRPLSTEQGMDKIQSKKKEAIDASSEEYSKESSKNSQLLPGANSEESDESQTKTIKSNKSPKSSEEEKTSSEEKPSELKIADKLRLNSKYPQKYKLKQRPKNKLEFKNIDNSDESIEEIEDEDQQKKKAEMERSSEEKGSSEEHGGTSSENIKSQTSTSDKRSEEEDSSEQAQHPKPSMRPIKYSYYNKDGEQQPKPTAGGLLNKLFGGKTKKKRPRPPPPHHPPGSNSLRPSKTNISPETAAIKEDSSEESSNAEKGSNQERHEDPESSEESKTSQPAQTKPLAPLKPTPAYKTLTKPPSELAKSKKDINKPVIIDPDKDNKPSASSKYPKLPRFPPPSRRHPETASSTTEPSTTTAAGRKEGDGDYDSSSREEEEEKSAEANSSASKDETTESKESSEEDPTHVKNIFTKGSISSLGESSDDDKLSEIPPPPPPIANWKPINTNETKLNFKNITKSPNAQATLVTPTHSSNSKGSSYGRSEEDKPAGSEEDKEDDSDEGVNDKQSNEDHSSEEKKKVVTNTKNDDDEADNKEPLIVPEEDDIPELGEDVITLITKPEIIERVVGPPAPALASVSNFDKINEIKVPMVPPSMKDNSKFPATTKFSSDPMAATKAVPNAAGPASPNGGVPGGSGPGGLPNPGGGNRMPGGGNRMPGGGNRMPGNRNPGGGNNNNGGSEGGEESSEEKSEEEVGQSPEDKTSEEEDEEDDTKNGRSGLDNNKGSKNKNSSKTKSNPKNADKPKEETPVTSMADPIVYGSGHIYPPLPPIYKWKSEPTLMTRLMKPKTVKPTLKLPKPSTTKDTFYSKPLSPMLVQYLRETYGNSYVMPPPKKPTTHRTTTTTPKPKKSKKKAGSAISFTKTFERAKLGGNQASDVIHFDEFEHVDNEFPNYAQFSHRTGFHSGPITKISNKSKIKKRRRIPVPPVFGKIITLGG